MFDPKQDLHTLHSFDGSIDIFLNTNVTLPCPNIYPKDSFDFSTPCPLTNSPEAKSFLFKCDPNLTSQLLMDHSQETLLYQTGYFNEQIESFLHKICSDPIIPEEFKRKLPLYQIFCSISKIFMLSEIEIVLLACMFDHCSWDVNEILALEEGAMLKTFPLFDELLNKDSKRLIIYLLLLAFYVKQHSSEKAQLLKIQAYCEKICPDFAVIYNKWLNNSENFKFSLIEINKKFLYLAQKGNQLQQPGILDYNKIVDEILTIHTNYTASESIGNKRAKKPVEKKNKKSPNLKPKAKTKASSPSSAFDSEEMVTESPPEIETEIFNKKACVTPNSPSNLNPGSPSALNSLSPNETIKKKIKGENRYTCHTCANALQQDRNMQEIESKYLLNDGSLFNLPLLGPKDFMNHESN